MKIKNIFYLLLVGLVFFFISCNGGSSGKQYDPNGVLSSTDENVESPANGGGGSPGGGSGGGSGDGSGDGNDNNDDTDSSKDICGAVEGKYSLKIINGVACSPYKSPVMKVLVNIDGGRYMCSGTLVDTDAVLTAGHCFKEIPGGAAIKSVQVVSGSNVLEVSNYYVQDGYNPKAGSDLAIVKLKNKVSGIAPVPIVVSVVPSKNDSIMTYGYGVTETGDKGSLRATYMKVSSVDSIWLVAGYDTTKTNVCSGDSGGPVVVKVKGIAGVVAITSFGTVADCLSGDVTYFPMLSNSKNISFIKKYANVSTL
ncbi:MAG: S1 family peptidase [Bdellovibrionota bacterium]